LSKNATITINALIVIDVHAKDVVAKLVEEKVSDSFFIIWQ
jgi:dynein heavy chain